jgi:hypothetical protein
VGWISGRGSLACVGGGLRGSRRGTHRGDLFARAVIWDLARALLRIVLTAGQLGPTGVLRGESLLRGVVGIATLPGIPHCEPYSDREHDDRDDDLQDNDDAHKKPSHSLMNQW